VGAFQIQIKRGGLEGWNVGNHQQRLQLPWLTFEGNGTFRRMQLFAEMRRTTQTDFNENREILKRGTLQLLSNALTTNERSLLSAAKREQHRIH
jgi:hypothetical protein